MAQYDQLSRPMLRAAAGFHADQARQTARKMYEKLCALDLHARDLTGFCADFMQLKNTLGYIYANDSLDIGHVGPSGLPVGTSACHMWAR